jgi:hypothetical protein
LLRDPNPRLRGSAALPCRRNILLRRFLIFCAAAKMFFLANGFAATNIPFKEI